MGYGMRRIIIETGKVVGLFVILGIGLGLAGYVGLDQFMPQQTGEQDFGGALIGALLIFQSITFMYFIGPVMAVTSGIFTGKQPGSKVVSAISGGAGSFVGYYLMFIIAFLIMTMALPETGGGGGGGDGGVQLGDSLVQAGVIGLPTGIVGGITGYGTSEGDE